eukprot:144435_1
MNTNTSNTNSHNNGIAMLSNESTVLGCSPPKKKRKKNNQCNLLLFKDFSYRCHIQNNILPTVYRAAKYNIKNLCPLHDMLPVITEMEKDPFKYSKESHFKGIRYTLRNGYLQNNNSNAQNAINNMMHPTHSDINNINNLSLWVCTGNKPECTQFKHSLLHDTDHKAECESESGVIEIPLNLDHVLLPFMNSLANGSQNTNLYFNVNANDNANNNELSLHYLPLDSLTIQNQINTKRISFKVLSCGTFKRNLQPMPDACRITKILDGQCCFTCIDEDHLIGLKITTNKVFDRKKIQGSDSILGTGFDCSSRCSWRKPRIYWVSKSIGYVRDASNMSNKLKKQIFTNQDIRISLLWPKHLAGRVDLYLGGVVSPYIEKINVPTYKTSVESFGISTVVATDRIATMPSPNQSPNSTDNDTKDIVVTTNNSAVMNTLPPSTINTVNFNVRDVADLAAIPPALHMNPVHTIPSNTLIYPMKQPPPQQSNPNTFNLFATPPTATNSSASTLHMNNNNSNHNVNTTYNCATNGVALGTSALSVDPESFAILTSVERDLITRRLDHPNAIHKLNVQAPYVLDALSQLLMFCIKQELHDVHCNYYVSILNHIAQSLGEQCAVDGFIKCWINMDTEDTVNNNANNNKKENLCSFMHLVTRYNRINLLQQTAYLFPTHHKALVNAFVDIRTTLYNESSLIIAIKNGYGPMVEYMLNAIWMANGMNSPIIMNNIITSPFNHCGVNILASLISFKLFSVLQFLLNVNCQSPTKFLSHRNIELINGINSMQQPASMNTMNAATNDRFYGVQHVL